MKRHTDIGDTLCAPGKRFFSSTTRPVVRRLAQEALSRAGYRVLDASGADAGGGSPAGIPMRSARC